MFDEDSAINLALILVFYGNSTKSNIEVIIVINGSKNIIENGAPWASPEIISTITYSWLLDQM